ncbi:DUF6790 family protein [Pseudolabrys sp. FHR47]|uniref:DUF6790 family protein n=1 Tax=Pseudolabrys sp. FHR47 TaxID=2562284 RepID=UPI0010BED6C3|nr:DUF6790 family protein [Pseudolabrys sp. FHR47]
MIEGVIRTVMTNFTVTFFVIGLACAGVALMRAPRPLGGVLIVEKLLAWFVFWTVGVLYLYNGIFHVFFGKMAAAYIGWADSPFQLEVGVASFGFAFIGFFAAFRSFELRVAAIVGSAIFLIGAAIGHAYQIALTHNMAPGNAGIMFYSDIVLPIIGVVLLGLQWKCGRPEGALA